MDEQGVTGIVFVKMMDLIGVYYSTLVFKKRFIMKRIFKLFLSFGMLSFVTLPGWAEVCSPNALCDFFANHSNYDIEFWSASCWILSNGKRQCTNWPAYTCDANQLKNFIASPKLDGTLGGGHIIYKARVMDGPFEGLVTTFNPQACSTVRLWSHGGSWDGFIFNVTPTKISCFIQHT